MASYFRMRTFGCFYKTRARIRSCFMRFHIDETVPHAGASTSRYCVLRSFWPTPNRITDRRWVSTGCETRDATSVQRLRAIISHRHTWCRTQRKKSGGEKKNKPKPPELNFLLCQPRKLFPLANFCGWLCWISSHLFFFALLFFEKNFDYP